MRQICCSPCTSVESRVYNRVGSMPFVLLSCAMCSIAWCVCTRELPCSWRFAFRSICLYPRDGSTAAIAAARALPGIACMVQHTRKKFDCPSRAVHGSWRLLRCCCEITMDWGPVGKKKTCFLRLTRGVIRSAFPADRVVFSVWGCWNGTTDVGLVQGSAGQVYHPRASGEDAHRPHRHHRHG